jgi:hypothetical protein
MQPGLTRGIVVPRLDGFVVDVRIMAAEASDLLDQSGVSVGYELLVTPTPQLIVVAEGPRHTTTLRFHGVVGHHFRIEWRQVAVPVDDSAFVAIGDGVHH